MHDPRRDRPAAAAWHGSPAGQCRGAPGVQRLQGDPLEGAREQGLVEGGLLTELGLDAALPVLGRRERLHGEEDIGPVPRALGARELRFPR